MNFELPKTSLPHLHAGVVFFDLSRGTSIYASARVGREITATCGDAIVNLAVESVQIGPLGQFFTSNYSHVSSVGRSIDVRSLADAVEAKCSTRAKDRNVLDPRELYTAIFYRVVSVCDAAAVMSTTV